MNETTHSGEFVVSHPVGDICVYYDCAGGDGISKQIHRVSHNYVDEEYKTHVSGFPF